MNDVQSSETDLLINIPHQTVSVNQLTERHLKRAGGHLLPALNPVVSVRLYVVHDHLLHLIVVLLRPEDQWVDRLQLALLPDVLELFLNLLLRLLGGLELVQLLAVDGTTEWAYVPLWMPLRQELLLALNV